MDLSPPETQVEAKGTRHRRAACPTGDQGHNQRQNQRVSKATHSTWRGFATALNGSIWRRNR